MFSPYRTNPNRTMIPAIITALDTHYGNSRENTEADIIVWLKESIPDLSETDIEFMEQWLKQRERCVNCGKHLLTTFTRDMTDNSPVKRTYQFCPDCHI